ncbi:hypothetical protein AURDEDRAFT_119657 [Auricularia subglabra TFB-10046 SS5]|nr:hypothetical protein AURDEDRAFT_119657 [Auricularia subglabra TFB-10046 SS5]
MSSNQSSQQPSGQDDRAKRMRTTEAGQAQSYPAYATPQPASHQAQAATAAAADAYRRRAQDAAAAQAAPAAPRPAHPPTDLPPRPYPGGGNPYAPPKPPGKITGAQMQYLPGLEARLDRLEHAVDQYVDMRAKKALDNSILPGSQGSSQSRGDKQQQQGPSGQSQQRK